MHSACFGYYKNLITGKSLRLFLTHCFGCCLFDTISISIMKFTLYSKTVALANFVYDQIDKVWHVLITYVFVESFDKQNPLNNVRSVFKIRFNHENIHTHRKIMKFQWYLTWREFSVRDILCCKGFRYLYVSYTSAIYIHQMKSTICKRNHQDKTLDVYLVLQTVYIYNLYYVILKIKSVFYFVFFTLKYM